MAEKRVQFAHAQPLAAIGQGTWYIRSVKMPPAAWCSDRGVLDTEIFCKTLIVYSPIHKAYTFLMDVLTT